MTTDDLVQRMVERAERAICWEDELEYRKANRGFGLCGCVAGKCSGTLRRLSSKEARAALLAALEEMRDAWNQPDYAHPDVRIDLLIERLKA